MRIVRKVEHRWRSGGSLRTWVLRSETSVSDPPDLQRCSTFLTILISNYWLCFIFGGLHDTRSTLILIHSGMTFDPCMHEVSKSRLLVSHQNKLKSVFLCLYEEFCKKSFRMQFWSVFTWEITAWIEISFRVENFESGMSSYSGMSWLWSRIM